MGSRRPSRRHRTPIAWSSAMSTSPPTYSPTGTQVKWPAGREVAVGVAFTTVMISPGFLLGPLGTGFLQEATGDLRSALLAVSFASASLSVTGVVLHPLATRGVKGGVILGHGAEQK